jgi:CubicO group peptidase (beta-lactamase class C family)
MPAATPVSVAPAAPTPEPVAPAPAPAEVLTADTPRTTVEGARFVAPAGWSITVRGPATILEAPEAGSRLALVDVHAAGADAAVDQAWATYRPDRPWQLAHKGKRADGDGWTDTTQYAYATSPDERRDVFAQAMRHDQTWTVAIYDMARAVGEKRGSQINAVFDGLLPNGYERESFAGKTAHRLDAARVAELTRFVDRARELFDVPAISLGLLQDGKVVFAGGFGVRELGKPEKPDADTLYIIASNTKALTTLLLAKLVDEHRLTWDTPVTRVMPSFKLGDDATTRSVLIKHLICACTGLPRQDLEWLTESHRLTPARVLALLGTVQPTSAFGALFQYSNLMAASAGFVAAYAISPGRELGAAYDAAMQARVFGPLGMTSTTFDFQRALRANHAGAYGLDIDGKPATAVMDINYTVIPIRPTGGAWSNVRDMLRYVAMELARGVLPDGRRYIGEDALLARRAPQVAISKDETYGMGLEVDRTWGVPVVHHGGDLSGYHSDMMWLPDHGVGAVILTNAQAGGIIRELLRRKLLEVLFDGQPLADAQLAAAARELREQIAADRPRLTVPPTDDAARLAARYTSPALGDLDVGRGRGGVVFDFGEWRSPVASRRNPDGSVSFVLIAPGLRMRELVAGERDGKRTLTIRDGQHDYVFVER